MELTKAVIFFVGCMVAVSLGLPANVKDQAEAVKSVETVEPVEILEPVETVKPVEPNGDQPIVDTGYFDGWNNPFSSDAFGGLFTNLQSLMQRMREQVAAMLSRLPLGRGTNSTDGDDDPAFRSFINGVDLPAFPNIGDIDLSKGNTSSVTKVIDGHKVVINETEYNNRDAFGGTFFKVRVIDVKPDSSELTTEKEAEEVPDNGYPRNIDREETDNSFENEIFKSKETEKSFKNDSHVKVSAFDNIGKIVNDDFENIETFDEVDSLPTIAQPQENSPKTSVESRFSTNTNSEWFEEDDSVTRVDSNAIDYEENLKERGGQRPIDLNRDTYVNEILAKNGAPVNPDAEVFYIAQNPEGASRLEKLIDPR